MRCRVCEFQREYAKISEKGTGRDDSPSVEGQVRLTRVSSGSLQVVLGVLVLGTCNAEEMC